MSQNQKSPAERAPSEPGASPTEGDLETALDTSAQAATASSVSVDDDQSEAEPAVGSEEPLGIDVTYESLEPSDMDDQDDPVEAEKRVR